MGFVLTGPMGFVCCDAGMSVTLSLGVAQKGQKK